MSESGPIDNITVYKTTTGRGDGADILFDFNGQLISVSIFPQTKTSSINNHLIDVLERGNLPEIDHDEFDKLEDEVLDVILGAGRHIFRQSAPAPVPHAQLPQSLHSHPSRTIVYFELKELNDSQVSICPITSDEAYACPEVGTREDTPEHVL